MSSCAWPAPPDILPQFVSSIHIWCAWLDGPDRPVNDLWQALSQDERERAERYRFEQDCRRFIVRRGLLRLILSRYTGLDPAQVHFIYLSYGKPSLASQTGSPLSWQDDPEGRPYWLRFNLSHSQGLALYAFAADQEIGVDVEALRSDFEIEALARRFFSPAEQVELRSLPASQQREAFFLCWTRKEAYIKARGQGLSLPLDQFDVTLSPGEKARLLATRPEAEDAGRWNLQHLDPAPGYIGALAGEGPARYLLCWQV